MNLVAPLSLVYIPTLQLREKKRNSPLLYAGREKKELSLQERSCATGVHKPAKNSPVIFQIPRTKIVRCGHAQKSRFRARQLTSSEAHLIILADATAATPSLADTSSCRYDITIKYRINQAV